MLNLMMFEWKKSWKVYVMGIVSVLIVYGYLVLQGTDNLYRGDMDNVIAMVLLTLLITVGSFFLMFHSISFLATDVGDKGYLIFSTPNSAWKILGAKLIVVFTRFFLWGLLMAAILFHMVSAMDVSELLDILVHNIPQILFMILAVACAALFFTMTIYFLISLTATVFSSWRHPVLLVVLAYFGLSFGIDWIGVKLGELVSLPVTFRWNMPLADSMNGFNVTGAMSYSAEGVVFNATTSIFYLLIAVALFMAAGYLLDRKLNI
jgi:hypothetical protein